MSNKKRKPRFNISALYRSATLFCSQRSRKSPVEDECWLGRVTRRLPGEEWPRDRRGRRLVPLATIFLRNMHGVPCFLQHLELITIFAPRGLSVLHSYPQSGFVIRTYESTQNLEVWDCTSRALEPCVLYPSFVDRDLPGREALYSDDKIWSVFEQMSEKTCETIEAEYKNLGHKLGGYPIYLQSCPSYIHAYTHAVGYQYVLQIDTDFEAGLRIGDMGHFYFYCDEHARRWYIHSDCC